MAKKRLNVTEVAEVLFNEISDFKAESVRLRMSIDQIKGYTVKIDENSLKKHELISNQINESIATFDNTLAKKDSFVPQWVFYILVVFFVVTVSSVGYGVYQMKEKNYQKEAAANWYKIAIENGYKFDKN